MSQASRKSLTRSRARGPLGGQVLVDVRRQRRAEVRLGRRDHEAAGPEQLQDLHHSRVGRREQVAGDLHRQRGRAHHAPLIERGVGLGRAHARAHQLRVHHQLAQALLGVGQVGVAQRLRHEQRHAEDELALGQVLGGALVRGVHRRAGGHGRAVDQVDVTQQEDALPGHQHVVEEDHAVHLLEARAQGMVEVRLRPRSKLSRQRNRSPGVPQGMAKFSAKGLCGSVHLRQARRVDGDLVGDRAQRGQHARPAHDHAGVGLAHHVERGALLQVEDARHRAAALQVDERVGQGEVALADVVVVARARSHRTRAGTGRSSRPRPPRRRR